MTVWPSGGTTDRERRVVATEQHPDHVSVSDSGAIREVWDPGNKPNVEELMPEEAFRVMGLEIGYRRPALRTPDDPPLYWFVLVGAYEESLDVEVRRGPFVFAEPMLVLFAESILDTLKDGDAAQHDPV